MRNTQIEKALKTKAELAKQYGVTVSAIVWMGGNRYIVVKGDKELVVTPQVC